MADYNFRSIEQKWQQRWEETQLYKADVNSSKPKYYVLDMFPYPSGAGLHVGHPLGYIASDIVSRYKRSKGFNVLHPMGFDSFGLPAEQYAIQTGQHPAITTEENISRYIEQLKNIGFSYDWSKEIRTSDPSYYKWTQWIFMKLFNSWYNQETDKAESIEKLITTFHASGNTSGKAVCNDDTPSFTADQWKSFDEKRQQEILLNYRLAFLSNTTVNWCPQLGTVLANDEVKDGVSERGGYPVVRKEMQQWSMRITAYAGRLLKGLEEIDWPEPLKEMQRNWIGRSEGASMTFKTALYDPSSQTYTEQPQTIEVFTTRPDTIYGVTFVVLAPEHEFTLSLGRKAAQTSQQPDTLQKLEEYVETARNRSERDRMSDVKHVTGAFTGFYAYNPFTNTYIPVWTADYVLAGYGTGAVMAVPSSDTRDYAFATHFNLPIIQVQTGEHTDISKDDFDPKAGTMINSEFLNGLDVKTALAKAIEAIEARGYGKGKTNYRMRDAIFGRQRYWGEPVPLYFKDGLPYLIDESELPLLLPEIDQYLPTETGEPPLGRAKGWKYRGQYEYELSTMPGWAGSSWYWYRYMDSKNEATFASKDAIDYWQNVDLYMGGSEHATGHLLYSRFWNKFLFDLGLVPFEEPFKKLINQGMIQGRSNIVYRLKIAFNSNPSNFNFPQCYLSKGLKDRFEGGKDPEEYAQYVWNYVQKVVNQINQKNPGLNAGIQSISYDSFTPIYVDVNIVENDVLDIEASKKWRPDFNNAVFVTEEDGRFICGAEVEKMSKSKFNVVNPDDMVEKYGADTLRMYEMFLGPLTDSKPWNTNGITGVHNFLRKFWRLFHDEKGTFQVSDEEPSRDELKVLHKLIKKVADDIENFSFNTAVSAFMVCVNELSSLKCNKKAILSELTIVLSPYGPHIAEEAWELLGNTESVSKASYPVYNEGYLTEDEFEYPISINGKLRAKMTFSLDTTPAEIEQSVLASEQVQKWLEGKQPKKIIVVPKRIVNVVI